MARVLGSDELLKLSAHYKPPVVKPSPPPVVVLDRREGVVYSDNSPRPVAELQAGDEVQVLIELRESSSFGRVADLEFNRKGAAPIWFYLVTMHSTDNTGKSFWISQTALRRVAGV